MSYRSHLLAAASLATLALSPVAQAQSENDAPDQEAASPDIIVVTAQKREQSILDVPLSVQSIGAEQLENAAAQDVAGLVRLIPGASVVSSSSRGFETIQIRGITSGTTGDGLTGYYIDDTPFGVPNLQLSPPARLMDIERVEVIRGPSGTIWGQGSMGGNIRLITAAPDAEAFDARITGEWSSTESGSDNYALDGMVNIPVVPDRFAVRISGSYDELGGYAPILQIPARDDANGSSGSNIRIQGLLTPNNRLSIRGTYWYINNEQDFSNGTVLFNPLTGAPLNEPAIDSPAGVEGFTNTQMDLFAATVEYAFENATLTSSTSFIDHTLDFEAPFTLQLALAPGLILPFPSNNDSTFETESFTQEFRLVSTGEGPFQWIVGAFYRDAEIQSDIDFTVDLTGVGFGVLPIIDTVGPLTTTSYSIYGEASVEFFDGRLVALAGLRHFSDERTLGPGLDRALGLPTAAVTADFDSLSPRFNLMYRPTDTATFYINIAKGFRSGAVQSAAQATAAQTLLGVPVGVGVDPDELWTYELGGRWVLAGGDLLIDAAVYQTDWQDIQLQFAAGGSIALANGGDASIQGLDIAFAWQTPVDGLALQVAANVNDAEFDAVVPALAAVLPTVQAGAALPNVPETTFSFAADYERELDVMGGSQLELSATYSSRSDTIDLSTGIVTDSLTDLSLSASLSKGNWRLTLFAANATDEDGIQQITATGGIVRPYPRRIGLRLGLDF